MTAAPSCALNWWPSWRRCSIPLAQEVLRRRYINGESYAEICDALALVERRVYQLHRLGVNKVCEDGQHRPEKEVQ